MQFDDRQDAGVGPFPYRDDGGADQRSSPFYGTGQDRQQQRRSQGYASVYSRTGRNDVDDDYGGDEQYDSQSQPADLVSLMGPDVFAAFIRSLINEGRARDATMFCGSSRRARAICQAVRTRWERDFPELIPFYSPEYSGGGPLLSRSRLARMALPPVDSNGPLASASLSGSAPSAGADEDDSMPSLSHSVRASQVIASAGGPRLSASRLARAAPSPADNDNERQRIDGLGLAGAAQDNPRTLLETALTMGRVQASRLQAARFCALYALYVQSQLIRNVSERQRAHARDLESGAVMQTAYQAPQSAQPPAVTAAAARGQSRGRAIRRAIQRILPLSPRPRLQREVAPHPDVVDVLRSPDDLSLGDLEAWARSLDTIAGYAPGAGFEQVPPWYVVQLGDEPQVPFGSGGPLFFVTSMSPYKGAVQSIHDARYQRDVFGGRAGGGASAGSRPPSSIKRDLDNVATSSEPWAREYRFIVRQAVNSNLKKALMQPIRMRTVSNVTQRRGVPRPEQQMGQNDPSEATLRALQRLAGQCESINIYSAYAPVSTYLAARPFSTTGLITYDVIIGLPLD